MPKKSLLHLFVLAALLLGTLPAPAAAQEGWRPLAPGIDYQVFTSDLQEDPADPIHVARMLRSHPDVTLDTTIAGGYINIFPGAADPYWTASGMDQHVELFNDTLNSWGSLGQPDGKPYWGNTSQFVVAINGDLWDNRNGTEYPTQGQFQSGWYVWEYQDFKPNSGFAWTMEKEAFIGGCTWQQPDEQQVIFNLDDRDDYDPPIEFLDENAYRFVGINVPRTEDRIYLYTPQFGLYPDQTIPDPASPSVDVVVQMANPLTITPFTETDFITGDVITGTVVDIRTQDPNDAYPNGPAPIGFDQIVLSAYGANAGKLTNFTIGQELGFIQRIIDQLPVCGNTRSGNSWTETYAAVGVDKPLVSAGVVNPEADNTNTDPRTAIAYDDQYIYFIAAEGHPILDDEGNYTLGRTGITLYRLGRFIKEVLLATDGVNLDGGGSTTMVVNGYNVTHTTDFLYCPQMYFPGIMRTPIAYQTTSPVPVQAETPPPEEPFSTPDAYRPSARLQGAVPTDESIITAPDLDPPRYYLDSTCNRRVPNGIAMISVQPKQVSTAGYLDGEAMISLRKTFIRQGPGTNYKYFAAIDPEKVFLIVNPGKDLNGVYATGTNWWYVEFNGFKGWVDERHFMKLELYQQRMQVDNP
jgi:hypothetical protein